jgi:hypothetical protein
LFLDRGFEVEGPIKLQTPEHALSVEGLGELGLFAEYLPTAEWGASLAVAAGLATAALVELTRADLSGGPNFLATHSPWRIVWERTETREVVRDDRVREPAVDLARLCSLSAARSPINV